MNNAEKGITKELELREGGLYIDNKQVISREKLFDFINERIKDNITKDTEVFFGFNLYHDPGLLQAKINADHSEAIRLLSVARKKEDFEDFFNASYETEKGQTFGRLEIYEKSLEKLQKDLLRYSDESKKAKIKDKIEILQQCIEECELEENDPSIGKVVRQPDDIPLEILKNPAKLIDYFYEEYDTALGVGVKKDPCASNEKASCSPAEEDLSYFSTKELICEVNRRFFGKIKSAFSRK